jgi:hypothetical protein
MTALIAMLLAELLAGMGTRSAQPAYKRSEADEVTVATRSDPDLMIVP